MKRDDIKIGEKYAYSRSIHGRPARCAKVDVLGVDKRPVKEWKGWHEETKVLEGWTANYTEHEKTTPKFIPFKNARFFHRTWAENQAALASERQNNELHRQKREHFKQRLQSAYDRISALVPSARQREAHEFDSRPDIDIDDLEALLDLADAHEHHVP